MLREYQLTNFKAFAGPETIPIRPITLIYGPNSSGKSSVLQSLLLLKQTLQEAENPEALLLPKGNLVNLGGYREFVHRHDISKPFSFKVLLDVDKQGIPEPLGKLLPHKLIDTPLLGLEVSFIYDEQTSNVVFSSVELFVGNDSSPVAIYKPQKQDILGVEGVESSSFPKTILKLDRINYEHRLWQAWWETCGSKLPSYRTQQVMSSLQNSPHEYIKRKLKRGWNRNIPKALQELQESINNLDKEKELYWRYYATKEVFQEIEALILLWQHFEKYTFNTAREYFSNLNQCYSLDSRNFLPIKLTNKFTTASSDDPETIKISQVYKQLWIPDIFNLTLEACSIFRHFLENVIYIGPLRDYPERIYILSGNFSKEVGKSGKLLPDVLFKNRELLKQVNEQLERFKLGYELKVSSFTDETSGISDLFALRLVDKDTGVNVSIQDVGFGISQVLPIIVQSMLSRNSTLLIEQPEIHIHPRLQAELGSLLAECIKPPFENQFIIETHSEHLMLRLQKLIRKGELKPEDISVIYVDRGAEGSKCLHLRLDEEGDFIDEWPDGFFEEDFNEIFQ